jgi:hypothetical protein
MPGGLAMNEVEIIRQNIERYRRLLQADLERTTRLTVQKLLAEFEAKLSAASMPASQCENVVQMR